jgi:hypothetical protein
MKILTTLTLITITMAVLGQTGPQGSAGSQATPASEGSSDSQTASSSQASSDLQVIDFGWTQHVTGPSTNVRIEDSSNAPVARPEPRSSTLRQTVPERLERIRDTNARMSDLHSLESEARASQIEQTYSTPRTYYEYHVRVKNAGGKQIQSVYWQYEIEHLDGQEPFVRQVFCKSKLKPEEVKQLKLYSFSSPRKVIKVSNREGASVVRGDEHVVINRIDFSDGSFWQRPNWIATIVPDQFAKKVGGGQCLGL